MKRLAPILAAMALAAALTAGAGAQQQTFWTAHAGPTGPVPIITPQPVYYDGYYYPYPYNCNNRFSSGSRRGVMPSIAKPADSKNARHSLGA